MGKISLKKTERENIYTIDKDKYDFNLEKKEPLGKRTRLTLSARILHDIIEKLSNLPHIDSYNSAINNLNKEYARFKEFEIGFHGEVYIKKGKKEIK